MACHPHTAITVTVASLSPTVLICEVGVTVAVLQSSCGVTRGADLQADMTQPSLSMVNIVVLTSGLKEITPQT